MFAQIFFDFAGDLAILSCLEPHSDGLSKLIPDNVWVPKKFVEVVDLDIAINGLFLVIHVDDLVILSLILVKAFKHTLKRIRLVSKFLNSVARFIQLVQIVELDVSSAHLVGELIWLLVLRAVMG